MYDSKNKITTFFNKFSKIEREKKISIILVTHILPDRDFFLEALSKIGNIKFIIPKPKSINTETYNNLKKTYKFISFNRDNKNYKIALIHEINKIRGDYILLDMGGYFTNILSMLKKNKGNKLLGIIEDTENGHQKYEKLKKLPYPVFSVARSSLKKPEDYLVGQSIVFSTNYILRMNNAILNNNTIGVIGYGKIGKSISDNLQAKNLHTLIYDINAIKRIEAISKGFESPSKKILLKKSDVIFCSSGNHSLTKNELNGIKPGCFIVSVTSSEDELDLSGAKSNYKIEKINKYTEIYKGKTNYFYLINKGNAVNFLHGAVVGNFIYLVQAEILMLTQKLLQAKNTGLIQNSNNKTKDKIAKEWIKLFNN